MTGNAAHEGAKARRGQRWRPALLDSAADDSREWLIYSRYWGAWHRRSSSGWAAGYTENIMEAGLFETSKARAYHDGVRDRAVHVTKVAAQLRREEQLMLARHEIERRQMIGMLQHLNGQEQLRPVRTRQARRHDGPPRSGGGISPGVPTPPQVDGK